MNNNEYRVRLSVTEDEKSIFAKGETFRYGFNKKSGLINSIEILNEDFLQGTNSEVPDIFISDAVNPEESIYAARYEDEAECDVISANPYEIHIRTHGVYHNQSGDAFPIRYRITYEIQLDGTIFMIVDNKAYEPCAIRWLCVSRGILNPSLCKYFSYLADPGKTSTTGDYIFKEITPQDPKLFSGQLIPWFWFGNDKTGIEICVWDITHHDTAEKPAGISEDNISGASQASGVLWEMFSLRNVHTHANSGWEQTSYFSMSVTPPKNYNSRLSSLCAYFEDTYLSDSEIKDLSDKGYDLLILNEFDSEAETGRIISISHKHGMRVIPRVSLMELKEKAHSTEWQIEPEMGKLMCPGAEGWREYWKQQLRKIEDYDFDGIYFDLSYDKLICQNSRHGCQSGHIRPNFIWVRDMLKYAFVRMKSRSAGSLIAANTDILPVSMICSWIDVRSVGKSQDIRHIDALAGKAFYSSYRLGCNSLIHTDQIQKIDGQAVALSLLYMAPFIFKKHSQEENLSLSYWNVLKDFGVNNSRWYPGFLDDEKVVDTGNSNLYVNIHKHNSRSELLLTLVNISSDEIHTTISLLNPAELGLQNDMDYSIYEPVSGKIFGEKQIWQCGDLQNFPATVPGYSPKMLCIREYQAGR